MSFFLISCSTHPPTTAVQPFIQKIQLQTSGNTDGKIVFLTFKINLVDSATDNYDVSLINTILAQGYLKKKNFAGAADIENGYLYYSLSADEKDLQRLEKTEDPLRTIYEYPAENGLLGKTVVLKKTGEIAIRFQYIPSLKYLSIYKPAKDIPNLKLIYNATILP